MRKVVGVLMGINHQTEGEQWHRGKKVRFPEGSPFKGRDKGACQPWRGGRDETGGIGEGADTLPLGSYIY